MSKQLNTPRNSFSYKREKMLSYCIEMLLGNSQKPANLNLEVMTLRAFALKSPPRSPLEWFSPTISHWEQLKNTMKYSGLSKHGKTLFSPDSATKPSEKMDHLIANAGQGLILIGPLNKQAFWNRYEETYHVGNNYFLVILNLENNKNFIVHDPEGLPYRQIDLQCFKKGLEAFHDQTGAILFPKNPVVSTLTCHDIFQDGYLLHQEHSSLVKDLGKIAKNTYNNDLTSKERASMFYGLPLRNFDIVALQDLYSHLCPSYHAQITKQSKFHIKCVAKLHKSISLKQNKEQVREDLERVIKAEQKSNQLLEKIAFIFNTSKV